VLVADEVQPFIQISRTVDIHVNEVNNAPVLTAIGNKTIGEFQTLSFTATAVDTDTPSNALTFSLDNGATGLVPAGATIDPVTGAFSWTAPRTTGPTVYRFDVIVTDNGAPARSDRETIEVTVYDVPVAAPSGLVSWWTGDGTANDLVGSNHGVVFDDEGNPFGSGLVGQTFSFDGVNDYISITGSPSLVLPSAFTLEFWFSPSTTISPADPAPHTMITTRSGATSIGTANSQGIIEVTGLGPRPTSTTNTWLAGQWYHVGLALDGSGYKLYVNGQVQGTSPATETIFSVGDLLLGRYISGFNGGNWFAGKLDEISLYNRTLAASEIQAIVEAGTAGKIKPASAGIPTAGLTSWWTGDGTANDSVGSNHGTLMNGATFGTGIEGQAFSFDGADDFVQILNNSSLTLSSSFSLAFWFNPTTTISPSDPLTHLMVGKQWNEMIRTENNQGVIAVGQVVGEIGIPATSTTTTWQSGVWHHVIVTFSGGGYQLFINGQLQDTGLGSSILNVSSDLFLGGNPNSPFANTGFAGKLDEIMLYNRTLNGAEIEAIYGAGIS
jgi:hypothetical protein